MYALRVERCIKSAITKRCRHQALTLYSYQLSNVRPDVVDKVLVIIAFDITRQVVFAFQQSQCKQPIQKNEKNVQTMKTEFCLPKDVSGVDCEAKNMIADLAFSRVYRAVWARCCGASDLARGFPHHLSTTPQFQLQAYYTVSNCS